MSTPGKVLVVLVTLTSLIWVVMVATVAQINTTGSEKVDSLIKQVETLEVDVAEAQRQLVGLKDQIGHAQVEMGLDVATIRSQQAARDKVRSDVIEMSTRAKLHLAGFEAALKSAQAARDQRDAEMKAETEAKAKAEAEVAGLIKEHSRLTQQLTKLTEEFRATLASNKRQVDRLIKSGGRQARPASYVP